MEEMETGFNYSEESNRWFYLSEDGTLTPVNEQGEELPEELEENYLNIDLSNYGEVFNQFEYLILKAVWKQFKNDYRIERLSMPFKKLKNEAFTKLSLMVCNPDNGLHKCSNPAPYIMVAIRNHLKDFIEKQYGEQLKLHKQKQNIEARDISTNPYRFCELQELLTNISNTIKDKTDRNILKLMCLEFTEREIAKELDIPKSTVHNRIKQLRITLEEYNK